MRYSAQYTYRLKTGGTKQERREIRGNNEAHARKKAEGIAKTNGWQLISFGLAS